MSAWHATARELHAQDPARSHASIAREIGVARSAVWKVLNPEKVREMNRRDNAIRGQYKRAYDDRMRATCVGCGGPRCMGSLRSDGTTRIIVGDLCAECLTRRRVDCVLEMWRLRRDGLTNVQIAAHMSTTRFRVAGELYRLRTLGYDVPAAPYRNAKLRGVGAPDSDSRAMGAELHRRGIYPNVSAAA